VSRRAVLGPIGDGIRATNLNLIERVGSSLEMALGQMQIDGSVLQGGMAQQKLDRPQIGSGFHQMGGEAMAKGMGANPLV